MTKLEQISETSPESIIADGFDDAIIGLSWDSKVVYDANKCIEILIGEDEITYDDAIEFLEFNTFSAYVGENTPIFIYPMND
jgi:hypothetical protein